MSTVSGTRRAQKRYASAARRRALTGSAFIAPAFIGLAIFYLFPLVSTVVVSTQKTNPFGGGDFVGAKNYQELFADPAFWNALGHSAVYTVISLIGIPLAIVIAALINSVSRGKGIYRVLYFLPVITLPVAVGMVWRYLYNGDFGLINQVLGVFGIPGRAWVADPHVALYAMAAVGIWMNLGTNIIILGSGLTAIPEEVFEASKLDGAGPGRQFFSITLPLLTPSVFFVSILTMISSLQMFDLVYVMIGNDSPALPGAQTIVHLFYQEAFVHLNQGYGAAIAIVLLMIIMAITAIQFKLQKRWVFYA